MDVKNKNLQSLLARGASKAESFLINSGLLIYPLKFAAAFFLSRGTILGSSAPFGIAVGAVCASGRGAVCAMFGAALGYLTILDRVNSLKYIACLILMYTAHFVFSGTELVKKRAFAPMSVLVPMIAINGVFLAVSYSPVLDAILFAFETWAAVLCTYLFSFVADTRKNTCATQCEFSAGLLAAAAAAVIAFSGLPHFFGISLGNVFAVLFTLLVSFTGGFYASAVSGAVFGGAAALAVSNPALCPSFVALGLVCALFSKKGKFLAVFPAVFTSYITALCLDASLMIPLAAESAVSAVLFFIISPVFSKISRFIFAAAPKNRDNHIKKLTSERLSSLSSAFLAIGNSLTLSASQNEDRKLDVPLAFDMAASQICKQCTLSKICWERDFEKTKDALNNATNAVLSNGRLSSSDFPSYFSSRCIHIENFVNSVNREVYAMKYRGQFSEKLRENRELISRQYTDTSAIFSSLATDIFENAEFDDNAENEITEILSSRGILCETAVYRDFEGHMNIHLFGSDLTCFRDKADELCSEISERCGIKLNAPQLAFGEQVDDVVIKEAPPFSVSFGCAVRRKNSDGISGDSGSFISPSNGKSAVILSDGMGTGKEAARESASSVKLLEGLLKTGMSPKNALSTLQSALMIKSDEQNAFATLDLAYFDLFCGKCDFFKLGGAPAYIKRGKKVCRITSSSLPAGMSVGTRVLPDFTSVSLSDGDVVVMVSDGVSDLKSDGWLLSFLSESEECRPREFAEKIIEKSIECHGKGDDMTAAVILFTQGA